MTANIDPYDTFWLRAKAAILDILILLPITMAPSWNLMWKGEIGRTNFLLLHWLATIVIVLYKVILTATRGQTLGKMAVGVKVQKTDGSAITYRESILRSLPYLGLSIFYKIWELKWLAGITIVTQAISRTQPRWPAGLDIIYTVAAIIVLTSNPKRRTIHDYIAGTEVVKVKVPAMRQTYINISLWFMGVIFLVFILALAHKSAARFRESVATKEVILSQLGITCQPVASGEMIQKIVSNSPAEKAGIKRQDIITAIDNIAVDGMPQQERLTKLQGPAGSAIALTLSRQDQTEPIVIKLVRQ